MLTDEQLLLVAAATPFPDDDDTPRPIHLARRRLDAAAVPAVSHPSPIAAAPAAVAAAPATASAAARPYRRSPPPAAYPPHPVLLTDFWPEEPFIWFKNSEARFRRGKVTASIAKYDYVLAKLSREVQLSIKDLLNTITDDTPDPYEKLKARLLDKFSPSVDYRINALLNHPPLGDQKPSNLMSAMLALLPDTENQNSAFVRQLFLHRLPQHMRDYLTTQQYPNLLGLASAADQMWDARQAAVTAGIASLHIDPPATVAAVSTPSPSSNRSPRRGRSPSRRSQSRRRSPTPGSRRSDPGDAAADQLCYYHRRFGAAAQNCRAPCSWHRLQQGNAMAAGGQ